MVPLGSARTGLNPYLRLMVTAWVSSCLFANLDIFLLAVGDLVNFLRLTLLNFTEALEHSCTNSMAVRVLN
ncbi:MAG: hypothetical protein QXK83_05045 [Zestosphaera sp.]